MIRLHLLLIRSIKQDTLGAVRARMMLTYKFLPGFIFFLCMTVQTLACQTVCASKPHQVSVGQRASKHETIKCGTHLLSLRALHTARNHRIFGNSPDKPSADKGLQQQHYFVQDQLACHGIEPGQLTGQHRAIWLINRALLI